MPSIAPFAATTEAGAALAVPWRLGCVRYLNAEPFAHGLRAAGVALRSESPSALGQAAAHGELDVALLSLEDYRAERGRFVPLGGFVIASRRAAQSVLLFSRRPLAELGGARIAVTRETSTSSRLLEVLLEHRYGVRGARTLPIGAGPADAVLRIGDAALRWRAGSHPFPQVIDLGAEWHDWTGLPFVFALWAVRREVPEDERLALRVLLAESLVRGLRSLDAIAAARADTGLGAEAVRRYLHGFQYVMGPEERAGMERFVALRTRGRREGRSCAA